MPRSTGIKYGIEDKTVSNLCHIAVALLVSITMVLVDYSSDSEPDQKPETGHINPALSADSTVKLDKKATSSPVRKRRKVSGANTSEASSALPPLPVAFHDLYASTVRVSTSDDPALHQGRKRVNPHRAGSWPTHLYIECKHVCPRRCH